MLPRATDLLGRLVSAQREVGLAHNGVMFLDELPEFQRHVLYVLLQPF